MGHRQRLKEKFIKSPEGLMDYEILELLLGYVIRGRDTKPLAKEFLKDGKGMKDILGADISLVKGAGSETETFIKLLNEFYVRVSQNRVSTQKNILRDPGSVYEFMKFKIGFSDKEHFIVIAINTKGELIESKIVSKGTINQAAVFVREVAEYSLIQKASSVIVAHNHPSGNLEFSTEDYNVTKKIKSALSAIEIELSDHVLVSKNGFVSMRQKDTNIWS